MKQNELQLDEVYILIYVIAKGFVWSIDINLFFIIGDIIIL